MNRAEELLGSAQRLAACCEALSFRPPVEYVYNPLSYAFDPYSRYLRRYAGGPKEVLFLGMNPGPWGMAQTGVPFGELSAVREWLGVSGDVLRPPREHPRKPVLGFAVRRSEVSGRRLWTLMRERFGTAERFFRRHFVGNYCPLMFLDGAGRNITPDRLPAAGREALFDCCDRHLQELIERLRPRWVIGIGRFTETRCSLLIARTGIPGVKAAGILHPSPANPRANRGWARAAAAQLETLGVWPKPLGSGTAE